MQFMVSEVRVGRDYEQPGEDVMSLVFGTLEDGVRFAAQRAGALQGEPWPANYGSIVVRDRYGCFIKWTFEAII